MPGVGCLRHRVSCRQSQESKALFESWTSMSENRRFTRFPVISQSAEYLVMGYLMRRNILTYKAPPNNEGYDLICIHPDPRKMTKQIRVQVKSRLATDGDGGFPVKGRTIDAFDYLIVAFLNVGYFLYKARGTPPKKVRKSRYSTPFLRAAFVNITTPPLRGRRSASGGLLSIATGIMPGLN